MADSRDSTLGPPAVFGWVSLLLGVATWLAPIAFYTVSYLAMRRAMAASHGVGAIVGGVPAVAGLALVAALFAGIVAGVVGLARHERDRWPAWLGLALTTTPVVLFVAAVALRSL